MALNVKKLEFRGQEDGGLEVGGQWWGLGVMWKSPPLILNIFCGEKSSPNGPGTDFLCIFCRSRLIITVLHAFWTNPRQGGANMLHHSNLVKTCLYHLLMTIANIFNRSFHGAMNFVFHYLIDDKFSPASWVYGTPRIRKPFLEGDPFIKVVKHDQLDT